MLEYIIVFSIVGWALWYTGRHLWRETKAGKCENCYCSSKKSIKPTLIRMPLTDEKKLK